MKPRVWTRRKAGIPQHRHQGVDAGQTVAVRDAADGAAVSESTVFDSAIHGVMLYLMALALAATSLAVHAEPTQAKLPAAAQMYVALHLQQYSGICSERYAAAGSPGQSSVCLHEAAVETRRPADKPVMRASLSQQGGQ